MADIIISTILRILLPIMFIVAALARPVGLSVLYILLLFITPWLLQTKSDRQIFWLKFYLLICLILSSLIVLVHVVMNCVHLLFPIFDPKSSVIRILRQVGFVNFSVLRALSIIEWLSIDLIVAAITFVVLLYVITNIKKGSPSSPYTEYEQARERNQTKKLHSEINRLLIIAYVRSVLKTSPIFALTILYVSVVLRPSVLGSFYFFFIIVAGTYWALYRQMQCGMHSLLRAVKLIMALQMICFVSYQLPICQKLLSSDTIWARMFALEALFVLHNEDKSGILLHPNSALGFESFLSPIALMCAYIVLTLNIMYHSRNKLLLTTMRRTLQPKVQEQQSSIPDNLSAFSAFKLEETSVLEQIFYIICEITAFIYKNSYILLNIVMMSWSIVYHSWLTFVLLLWANILWMVPNQRHFMMRSSFFVVLYAQALILVEYIYCMNFNKSELPSRIFGVSIEQIGFAHPQSRGVQPYISLTVKTIFLIVFWITSHQYFKEKAEDIKEHDLFVQLFALRQSRSTISLFEKSKAPRILINIFESISNFVARIWMWLLILLIFLCAMIDQDMTGFRICYMSLFLLFLMVFQMSLKLWTRFLYGYWIFVIFYAMTILTIIYTYQFDNFDYYWEKYLRVQPTLQNDIGLRKYRTKDLFLYLLIPTLTVIFTVVQLHYFHRLLMQSVRQPSMFAYRRRRHSSGVKFTRGSKKTTLSLTWRNFLFVGYRKTRLKIRRWFTPAKQLIWRFLEMHMIKVVILTTFICGISEISCFNIIIIISALLSVCVNRFMRRIILRIVTFWVSILILMKMMYQIKYMDKAKYDYKCRNSTVNLAAWMGLRKADNKWSSLLQYISPYIIYMIVTTIYAVVKLRDHLIRSSMKEMRESYTLFPKTSRQDAERNFPSLLKYLFNYGYFKFGWEITLICLVASIANRRDALAITYIFWLILLLCLSRRNCARIWPFFQFYMVLSILIQYLYLIHFPPNLCVEPKMRHFHANMTLAHQCYNSKLLLDFILLLFIVRQRQAFHAEIENFHNITYPGGDNKDIVHNIAKLGHVYFKNPTHDFCSFVRNYSDVFKIIIFCGFLWVTLSVILLGGICSQDMLSLGYLIFTLVFLIQGSEVYLQNIHYIICRWNFLIGFNVFNIAIKVLIIVFAYTTHIKSKKDYQNLFAVMKYEITFQNKTDGPDRYFYGPDSLIFENTLAWQAIIFAFIIFQSRIFRSYYFCHIIMDTQANTVLASRGAIIIKNLHYKQIYDRRETEKRVLENIKTKMELIRASNKNYRRGLEMHGSSISEIPPPGRRLSSNVSTQTATKLIKVKGLTAPIFPYSKKRDMRLHPHAVHSGDYYMFEEYDTEEPVLFEEFDFLDREDLHTRQTMLANRPSHHVQIDHSSDTEIDFETHPIVKLSKELMILVTFRLYRLSRSYRFVHKVLSAEKKTLQDISTMNRLGLVNTAAMFSFLNQSLYNKKLDSVTSGKGESNLNIMTIGQEFSTLNHGIFVKMMISIWYAIIANTEALCYLAVFVNQAANSAVISLPLPLLVLYWGALTVPRPTKTFWVTVIAYTLAMIFLKCMMHQKIVIDSKISKIAQTSDFELLVKHGIAVYDLLLLVMLFWHRYMLKKQGIWNMPPKDAEYLPISKAKTEPYVSHGPSEVLKRLREESGSERPLYRISEFEQDVDDLLKPGKDNKYIHENIESDYYLSALGELQSGRGCCFGFRKFFLDLLHKARLDADVYTLIFLCDFINFFVLLFGFPKFVYRHKYTASVLETYIQGNKVPYSFLFMLLVQFFSIVAERAIYLRKALKVKIAYHFCTAIGIHLWMFFLVPYLTSHSFGAVAPVLFYLIKCLHMMLSTYQIRCGYPKRILGNVFTKSFSMVNYVAFKVYMEIPFLYILRTLLDWLFTNTTLTVMEWIKMEDIFQSVFTVRCYRQIDADFPVLRGEPKAFYTKCLVGGTMILILIALIWSPLFLFALVGTVGKPNIPRRADISVKIGHYEPIYVSQTYLNIHRFSKSGYSALLQSFENDIYATDHIQFYEPVDVTVVKFDANSVTLWSMSPPDKSRLLRDLKSDSDLDIRLALSFVTGPRSQTVKHETTYRLPKENKEKTREMLVKSISDDKSNPRIVIPDLLPKFITIQKMEVYANIIKDPSGNSKRPITVQKIQSEGKSWWNMHDYCDDKYYKDIFYKLPLSDCSEGVVIYIFNDKSFPSTMSFFEKTGIIGLYTTGVYVVSRLIRSLIANNHRRIMFEDLPYVDRILKLCNDIYLVREKKEYLLEEDLYAKLIFLYRSPETLIKWTRFKDGQTDDLSASDTSLNRTSPRDTYNNSDIDINEDEDDDDQNRQPPRAQSAPPP